jgi:hypothetical protein
VWPLLSIRSAVEGDSFVNNLIVANFLTPKKAKVPAAVKKSAEKG